MYTIVPGWANDICDCQSNSQLGLDMNRKFNEEFADPGGLANVVNLFPTSPPDAYNDSMLNENWVGQFECTNCLQVETSNELWGEWDFFEAPCGI